MKKTILNLIRSCGYFSLYILIQGILSLIFFTPICLSDKNTEDLFYYGMISVYEKSNSRFEVILNSMPLMTEIFSGFLYYITLLSGIILILIYLIKNGSAKQIFSKKITLTRFIFLYGCGIGLNLITSATINLLGMLFPIIKSLSDSADSVVSGNFFIALFAVGIIGPITEEIVFRHGFITSLEKINPLFAIIFSSVLFGLMHINPVQVVYAGILGLLFGILYQKTKKLSIPILLHIGINSSSVILHALCYS